MNHYVAAPQQYRPLRPVRTVGLLAVGALALTAVPAGVDVIGAVYWLSLSRNLDGSFANLEDFQVAILDNLDLVSGVSGLLAWLAAAVLFIVWMFRARTNVDAFDRYVQNWARPWLFFGWVVPFANLVIPRRIVVELWIGSHPHDTRARQAESTPLINFWWGFFLFSWFLGRAVGRMDPGSVGAYDFFACLSFLDGVVEAVTAALAVRIVLGVNQGLQEMAAERGLHLG